MNAATRTAAHGVDEIGGTGCREDRRHARSKPSAALCRQEESGATQTIFLAADALLSYQLVSIRTWILRTCIESGAVWSFPLLMNGKVKRKITKRREVVW